MKRLMAVIVLLAVPGVARAQQAEVVEYYAQDAIGSIRVVFDVNGAVKARQDYEPFGRAVFQAAGMAKEDFVAQERDGETDQGYFHARMLQARIGRFTRPDPMRGGLFAPQAWNRYAYALNSPIGLSDPSGLVAEAPTFTGTSNPGCDLDPLDPDCRAQADRQLWADWWWAFGGGGGGNGDFPGDDVGGGGSGVGGGSDTGGGTDSGPVDPGPGPGPNPPGPNPPGPNPPVPPPGPKTAKCFIKGLGHGAVGGLLVAGGAAVASAVLAPEVVTAGLLAAGGYGGYRLIQSIRTNITTGNEAGLAYSMGSVLGGAAVGGATSYGVRYSITGETGGPSGLLDFSGVTKLTNPFRSGNSILGNLRAAFAKGPDLLGGGAAIAGGAGYGLGGC